jgi:hypothetical protein
MCVFLSFVPSGSIYTGGTTRHEEKESARRICFIDINGIETMFTICRRGKLGMCHTGFTLGRALSRVRSQKGLKAGALSRMLWPDLGEAKKENRKDGISWSYILQNKTKRKTKTYWVGALCDVGVLRWERDWTDDEKECFNAGSVW